MASKVEKQHMVATGAVKAQAGTAGLITVELAVKVARRVNVPAQHVAALEGVGALLAYTAPAEPLLLAAPATPPAPPGGLPLCPASLACKLVSGLEHSHSVLCAVPALAPGAVALPTTLPACIVPASRFKKQYSLPELEQGAEPLRGQLAGFKAWCTNSIQLDREKGGALSGRTWQNIFSSIMAFLGFCHFNLGLALPDLLLFADPETYAHYMAFLLAKELSINSFTQQISHARKVLTWLGLHAAGGAQQFDRVSTWMGTLRGQLVSHVPPKRKAVDQLQEQGAWMPTPQLVAMLENLRVVALEGVPAEAGELCTQGAARVLHDAAMTSCMYGYLPPVRLASLRHL